MCIEFFERFDLSLGPVPDRPSCEIKQISPRQHGDKVNEKAGTSLSHCDNRRSLKFKKKSRNSKLNTSNEEVILSKKSDVKSSSCGLKQPFKGMKNIIIVNFL